MMGTNVALGSSSPKPLTVSSRDVTYKCCIINPILTCSPRLPHFQQSIHSFIHSFVEPKIQSLQSIHHKLEMVPALGERIV